MKDLYILIAEDDADDRYLLQNAFDENGNEERIEFVENGVEVIDFLNHVCLEPEPNFPVFILLDLNMPKKDGREVLKEMKSNPLFKKIPVIVFTTTKNETEIQRCYELGANTYVVKPVSFDMLLKVVQYIKDYWFSTAVLPL